MKPEAQRIAIAEACGWKFVCDPAREWDYAENPKGGQCNRRFAMDPANKGPLCVPDYLNDLNAMHEAEKVLTDEQWDGYINWHLRCTVAEDQDKSIKCSVRPMPGELNGLIHATAAQRAKAFLLAVGQWGDEP